MPKTKTKKLPVGGEFQQIAFKFKPLTSRADGKARLTFMGLNHGFTKDETRGYMQLIWACMDVTKQYTQNLSILTGYRVEIPGENANVLTRMLMAIGYKFPDVEAIANMVEEDPDDEFGYYQKVQDVSNDVYAFLETCKGQVYKAYVETDERKFYRIDVNSIEPLMKEGKPLRDFQAGQVGEVMIHQQYAETL